MLYIFHTINPTDLSVCVCVCVWVVFGDDGV